ncbi:CLUMA_CG017827, isoform A [Clunio marinus]|uniref:CLUMA_CG017827, isoform A n=1 Tax=Clunio marinus TaxID=568069 RepID=A0A1J1IX89_9DIPT|nr:CLUMA_CG017827, isoform A [Clunio marinus]
MDLKVEKICRICLSESEELESIFKYEFQAVPIINILRKVCYSLRMVPQENDNLPSSLCPECLEILCRAHKLNNVSVDSDSRLRKFLQPQTSIKEETIDFTTQDGDSPLKLETNEFELSDCKQNVEEITFGEIETEININEDSEEKDSSKIKKTPKRHQCSTCLRFFEKPSKLLRHLQTHDVNKKPFACEQPGCFQRFLTDASLKRHAILHSGMTIKVQDEKTYECVVCSKPFKVQEALASHMRTHKDIMDKLEFPCNLCDKVFKKLNDLTRHSRKHPENKSHKCLICSKMFSQGSHLIDHLNRHKNLRPHVCNICNKAFQQSSTLKDHLRTHTSEKPFLCSECGKSFNNPSNLRQHVKRHLNLKEFECHLCPGKFSCKASLDSHIRSHSGIKPHVCNTCGSAFTKGSSLKKHIRTIHEGIKPYECEACPMKFNSSEHLKRHFRTHTGEKPYKCDIEGCDRAYAQSNDLLKHKKIHIGVLVYKCTICTDAFRLQSQLRDHYKIHYKGDGNDN